MDSLCQDIAERSGGVCLLSFSRGKDALGAWLQCRKFFKRVVPYHLYLVPDLEFVEKSLQYYERFFGVRCVRLPHPSLYRMLNNLVFQPPENCAVLESAALPNFDYEDIMRVVKEDLGLPLDTWTATGIRATDSPNRRIALAKNEGRNESTRVFYPVYDWNKDRLLAELQAAGVKLPIDYKLFNRTFDGLDYRFLEPIKRAFPADYQRILNWFPLADLELFREGCINAHRV